MIFITALIIILIACLAVLACFIDSVCKENDKLADKLREAQGKCKAQTMSINVLENRISQLEEEKSQLREIYNGSEQARKKLYAEKQEFIKNMGVVET